MNLGCSQGEVGALIEHLKTRVDLVDTDEGKEKFLFVGERGWYADYTASGSKLQYSDIPYKPIMSLITNIAENFNEKVQVLQENPEHEYFDLSLSLDCS